MISTATGIFGDSVIVKNRANKASPFRTTQLSTSR
jgi:hypothetical protein